MVVVNKMNNAKTKNNFFSSLISKARKKIKLKKSDNSFSIIEVCLIILCTTVIGVLVGVLLDKKLLKDENKYSDQLNYSF